MPKALVIGGGVSGLFSAYFLQQQARQKGLRDFQVHLYEKSSRVGGIVRSVEQDSIVFEEGPDSFINEKPMLRDLCDELGIAAQLLGTQEANRRSFIYQNERLIGVPEGFYLIGPSRLRPFMVSKVISLKGKLRMLSEILIPARQSSEDESVGDFVRRRFGQEALDKIAGPMLAGIYTADPDQLSLQMTMPKFIEMEKKHGSVIAGLLQKRFALDKAQGQASGPRYSLFLSFKKGMQTLTDALALKIGANNIFFDKDVTRVNMVPEGLQVSCQDGSVETYQKVVCAIDKPHHSAWFQALRPQVAQLLSGLHYESAAIINMLYKRSDISHPLNGFGFVVPAVAMRSGQCPMVGCSFISQKYAGRCDDQYALFRAFVGGAYGRSFYQMNDKDLTRSCHESLSRLLGIRASAPLMTRMGRYDQCMVQYPVGHAKVLKQLRQQPLKNFGVCSAAHGGVGIPDRAQEALEIARTLTDEG